MRASNLCNIYDCACTTIYLYAKKAPFPRPNTIQASDKEQKTRINPARIIRPVLRLAGTERCCSGHSTALLDEGRWSNTANQNWVSIQR